MSLAVGIGFVASLLSCAVAVVPLLRSAGKASRYLFAIGMALLAWEAALTAVCFLDLPGEKIVRFQTIRLFVSSLLPATWLTFSLTYSRGDSRQSLHRWRWMILLSLALPLGIYLAAYPTPFTSPHQIESSQSWFLPFTTLGFLLNAVSLLGWVIILANLERTFRASVGTLRWRIKYMVIGLAVLFGTKVYSASQAMVYSGIRLPLENFNTSALVLGCFLLAWGLVRDRTLRTDLYPSHAFLYNSLTVLLTGIYLLVVGGLAKIASVLGTQGRFPLEAFVILIALVVLTALLLSERLQQQVKRFLARHFQRSPYDYRAIWRTFSEKCSCQVEEGDLCRVIAKLVSDLFHVLSVTIWLADQKRERLTFAASTSIVPERARALSRNDPESRAVIAALKSSMEPIDLDASREPWAETLRLASPAQFAHGGHRYAVGLRSGAELVGFFVVGDRVNGIPFNFEDLELLKAIADQVAGDLLNLRLSQQLMQAKEMEAFQTMAAFFVHDLKNTASTFSIMLQNLSIHFSDPAFREEALRAVSKSVNRINELVGRLTLLRQAPKPALVDSDLNGVVQAAVAGLEGMPNLRITKDLQPLPKVSLDPDQIHKVFTNLLLNAKEAGADEIRIETACKNGWAVLTVKDNGCGMSPEFVARQLFRPFQTTKKKGIGIGMFHSKIIVEAHGGRIEVLSEERKGTLFQIMLPLVGRQS